MGGRLVTLAIAGLGAVFAGLIGLLAYQTLAGGGTAVAASVGGAFELEDGSGKTVSDQSFRGRWMLVYFGYTHCPDACPTALNDEAVALSRLGPLKAKLVPIFITVDPERDTADVMKDYVAAFGPEFVGLTGSGAAIQAVEHEYKVYAAKHPLEGGDYAMDHSSYIYVMDPEGRFVTTFTHETSPDDMAKDLKQRLG
jgi:protein SCO1/2